MKENKKITTIEKKSSPIITLSQSIQINNDKDLEKAVEVLSKLNKFLDQVTEEKEKITKPLLEALKVERARWKPLETQYENSISVIREKMSVYQTAQKELQERVANEAVEKISSGEISLETAVSKLNESEVKNKVEANSGSVSFITVKKYEVIDITKVPVEYLLPNDVKIRADMKAGIQVEGVRYYEVQEPRNYR
jgi:antitoxin component HigA of HigAB toxin-antitoxin module